jgi:type IV pilus assembly protein PilW
MQELRATAGVIARDLRRAGHWAAAARACAARSRARRPSTRTARSAPKDAASDAVQLSFSRDAGDELALDDDERFGFRLRNGVSRGQLGAANWQASATPAPCSSPPST